MSHSHSYRATLENNKTETSALDFLLASDNQLRSPTKTERKEILKRFGLEPSFSRAFDIVRIPDGKNSDILSVPLNEIVLVEMKTTQKKLPHNPDGFFFGATENEFRLAEKLGDQYLFCFVTLHPESAGYVFLTAQEVNSRLKTKRIQYQINL